MPRRPRRGLATVEFVMVCPLLLFLMAGVFLIARAGVAKAAAATNARAVGWGERRSLEPADVFDTDAKPLTIKAIGSDRQRVATGTLFRTARFEAESAVTVTDRVWDFRDQTWQQLVYVTRIDERPYHRLCEVLPGGKGGNLSQAVLLSVSVSVTAAPGDASNAPALMRMFERTLANLPVFLNPLGNQGVAIAGEVLYAMTHGIGGKIGFQDAVDILEPIRDAAALAGNDDFADELSGYIDTFTTAIDCFSNLRNASRGLAVGNPGGWGG